MADDPYEVLGLSRGASAEQIAEAYRALVQIYHPDRYGDAPPRVRDEALRRMQAVNAALGVGKTPRALFSPAAIPQGEDAGRRPRRRGGDPPPPPTAPLQPR